MWKQQQKENLQHIPASLMQPTMAAPAADFEARLARRPRSTGPRRIQAFPHSLWLVLFFTVEAFLMPIVAKQKLQ